MKNFVIVAIVLVLVIGGIIWWQKRPAQMPVDEVAPVATTTEEAAVAPADGAATQEASVDAAAEAVQQ